MTKPYSLDLRERVAARVLSGETVRSVAATFTVSVATVVRWSQRLRATGHAGRGQMGGHRRRILADEERAFLLDRLTREPDVSLRKLVTELADRGVDVSYGTMWNFIHREGLSFKKNRAAKRTGPAQGRAT
jgi:transposase